MRISWTFLRAPRVVARGPRCTMVLVVTTVLAVFATQLLQAQSLTVLYSFKGSPDGSGPAAPIKDKQGNLYTTTYTGGAYNFGAVVKTDPAGNDTVLHDFTGGSDGSTPTSSLIIDSKGNLYGTTYTGGGPYCFGNYGCGVVFELSPGHTGWTETVLHSFTGAADGAHPGPGQLVRDAQGNLYGTTQYGGITSCSTGCGVVFKITNTRSGWKGRVLHAFEAAFQTDGNTPEGGVTLDGAGNVYGTTYYGGTYGLGTVFKIDSSGSETVLYSFQGGASDGGGPFAAPVLDEAGNLYGTTAYGGDVNCAYPIGCGTVFKLDPNGAETLLHIFAGYPNDGEGPGQLVRDQEGNLYATAGGGNSMNCLDNNQPAGCGTIFKVDASGKETILYNFTSGTDGLQPTGVTLYGGRLYGAVLQGGAGNGTVFRFTR